MEHRIRRQAGLGFAALLVAQLGWAQQQVPDAGAVLRETDPAQRSIPPPPNLPRAQRENLSDAAPDAARVNIASVRVIGSTRYNEAEWQPLFSDVVGHDLTYADLRRAADRVARRYRDDGRFARAYLPEQALTDGVLTIAVVEAKLGEVRVEGPADGKRVSEERIRKVLVAGQQNRNAVAIDELERAAMLLEDMPGIHASVVLAPGDEPGETDILARIDNTRRFGFALAADNAGLESTGRGRLNGELRLESPFHIGDELAGFFDFSEGTAYGRVSYDVPLGSRGWRIRPAVSRLDYDLGGRFSSLDAHGRAETWGVTAGYPLIRTDRVTLRLAAGFEERRYENFALGEETSQPKVRAFLGTLSLDRTDGFGGGGFNRLALQVTRGRLDLADNPTDLSIDAATARSDGKYTAFDWSLARLQRLADRDRLLVSITGQVASRNLGSSEKMSLGGDSGVRAFPVLEASGDEGWIATTEWIHLIARDWRISAFYDYGRIEQHKDTWAQWNAGNPALRNHYALQGAGLSAGWSHPRGFELHGSVATRTARNPARNSVTGADSDGSQREPQFWVTSRWQF